MTTSRTEEVPPLRALHSRDADAVIGRAIPDEWECGVCKSTCSDPPAAYVKRRGGFEFLCISCLLTYRI